MKVIINFGLFLFLGVTTLLTIVYGIALADKMARPQFKNLSGSDYFMLGVILFVCWIGNYFIVRRLLKRSDT